MSKKFFDGRSHDEDDEDYFEFTLAPPPPVRYVRNEDVGSPVDCAMCGQAIRFNSILKRYVHTRPTSCHDAVARVNKENA